jgi:hypothetical protein
LLLAYFTVWFSCIVALSEICETRKYPKIRYFFWTWTWGLFLSRISLLGSCTLVVTQVVYKNASHFFFPCEISTSPIKYINLRMRGIFYGIFCYLVGSNDKCNENTREITTTMLICLLIFKRVIH